MNVYKNNTTFRSFIAFELPKEVKSFCSSLQQRLKTSGVTGKWVRSDNQHLTINFLGYQTYKKLLNIKKKITQNIHTLEEIEFQISELSSFGKPPKVLILKIIDINKNAEKTVKFIEEINSLTPNHKTWIPHLTLARFRGHKESKTLGNVKLIKEFNMNFTPEKITVFKST